MADAVFTRRAMLRATIPTIAGAAALPAVAAETNAPALPGSTAEERAQHHWIAFCRELETLSPSDCQLQIYGRHVHGRAYASLAVTLMRVEIEQVHPRMRIPVERGVATLRLDSRGWSQEEAI